ncbi:hypothetical protein BC938DRAFT_471928 [Jimgerdemannia flammicorona]|uniref:Uncharacterized protein n=1 Tax=Jimgerdemannia flammicorona TaxID=994334 RepID=A0A433Q762_9FUNG|nr:hypothetical protein BC938DRAFT_471928 [Jimgerdemannia flammicorona]
MDIFQGPFRVVFEDSPEQLPLLLDKLRRQYEVAETAQVKHAVLRALFPVLKALVEEAGEEEVRKPVAFKKEVW